jgi:O-antigen/teichoic acid export membrane protein
LTRRIALAKGKSGGDPNAPLTPETLREIADLVEAGKRIYRVMAAGVFIVSWALGFFYLRSLELHGVSQTTVWIAWTILCASQAVAVFASIWTCLLQGVGYVGWDALIATFIGAGTLLAQIIAVLCGGRLIALAIVATCGALAQRAVTLWFSRVRRPELFSLQGRWNPDVLRGMPSLAFRAWLTAVGTILVQNTDGFFIASLKGAQEIPTFRAAFLIVLNLHMLAAVFASSSSVFITHLWQASQIGEVQRIVQRNLRLGLTIVLCGGAAILTAGSSLFEVWLGPSNYVGGPIVALFLVTFVLEQQTYIISTGSRATEDEAFGGIMMTGGVLKLLLAFFLTTRFGLVGLAWSTLIAQLLTAHWFVLNRGLRRLQFGFDRYLFSVAIPCLVVFAVAYGISFLVALTVRPGSNWIRLASTTISSGLVLVAALWFLVLERRHRAQIIAFANPRSARASRTLE